MLPPQDECITEIQQQWISTPFEDHITVSQDLSQDPQVNTVELSFDLHFPNLTQERISIKTKEDTEAAFHALNLCTHDEQKSDGAKGNKAESK